MGTEDYQSGSDSAPQPYTIHDIPNEMLAMVLAKLDRDGLNAAVNVCRLWFETVYSVIGFPVTVPPSQEQLARNDTGRLHGLEVVSRIGVKEIRLEEGNVGLFHHPSNPIPLPKKPEMLKLLCLRSDVSPELFWNLTAQSVNLVELELAVPLLCHLKLSDFMGLQLQLLRRLTMASNHHYNYRDQIRALPNLRLFLNGNHFRRLESVRFNFPAANSVELATTGAAIQFLLRHPMLNEIEISSYARGKKGSGVVDREMLHELLDRINGELRPSSIVLYIHEMAVDAPARQLWQELVQILKGVEKLELLMGPLSTNFVELVMQRNRETMKMLEIGQITESCDLRVFAQLRTLNSLVIREAPEFSGAAHLPNTLQRIHLEGKILTADFRHLLFGLPELKHLRLDMEIGPAALIGEDRYALDVHAIQHMVQRVRRLKTIKLTGSLLHGEDILSDDDPTDGTGELDLILDEMGYYVHNHLIN